MGFVGGSDGKGNGSRKRPFGMMVLVAFALALLGVLLLNKFRDRRIFNLLLKEKDTDLLSLHFLLQKQVDRSKELERTKDEMKEKLYALRTQKIELDRRLIEMESTMEILKEEQKTLEATLEVKQDEQDNPQLRVLQNTLKEKEDEIDDLKNRLQSAANLPSGYPDKAENGHGNHTEIPVIKLRQGKDRVLGLTLNRVAENASMGDHGRERTSTEATPAETSRRVENGTEQAIDSVRRVEVEDPSARGIHRKENEITIDGQQELQTGKHEYKSGAKEKRGRYVSKKRKLGNRVNNNYGSTSIRTRKFYNEDLSKRISVQESPNEKQMEGKSRRDDYHSEVQNIRNLDGGQKSSDKQKEDEQADHIQQISTISRNIKVKDSDKRADNIDELKDIANLKAQETEADISSGDFSEESASEMADDRGEYKEEAEE